MFSPTLTFKWPSQKEYYSLLPMCLRCHWNRIALSLVSNVSINAWSLHQRSTLCTNFRKSSFRKWSPYTRCRFKRFLKSPGIHCRIKAFWRLTIDPHWCFDIYSPGRRVWQIIFAYFFFSYSNYSQHKCEKCFDSSYRNITLDLIILTFFSILHHITLIFL